MFARLWWKEARVFWPIWLALGIIALGVQWLMLWVGLEEARMGMLIPLALSWSSLYAFAVAASAFAGERETNTLVLLDTMPVGRAMLWTSKVSFALATTLGLALVLAGIGALGTTSYNPRVYPMGVFARGFGTLLFEATAWTLLVSAVLDTALQSALVGLMVVGFLNMLLSRDINLMSPDVLAHWSGLRVALACGALALSRFVFTRGPQPDRTARGREASDPDVPARAARRRGRSALGAPGSTTVRLAWETVRESRRTWLLLAGFAIGLPLLVVLGSWQYDAGMLGIFAILASLLAGVSVFGPLNRMQGYRFLVYHGVRPGLVWATRAAVWGVAMAMFTSPMIFLSLEILRGWPSRATVTVLWFDFLIISAFIVGLFCGQVLRRGITAWVVACLMFALLVLPQAGLAEANMIPLRGLALFPMIVLLISWTWSGSWMNDLRGMSRWLGLGAMLGTAGTFLVALYIGYRAWSVPDIGPPFVLAAVSAPNVAIPPEQDAAPDYTRILSDVRSMGRMPDDRTLTQIIVNGWNPRTLTQIIVDGRNPGRGDFVDWWESNRGLIPAIRRAAEKPRAGFSHPDVVESPIDRRFQQMNSLAVLLGLDSAERRSRGDLAGAWDDLRAIYGISAQVSQSAVFWEALFATRLRTMALQWSLAWAADPGQTSERLRATLADFRTLPPLAPPADTLEAEYALIVRTFRRAERDPDLLLRLTQGEPKSPVLRSLLSALMTPTWERERARRVFNLLFAEQLRFARLEPWEETARRGFRSHELAWYEASTPLITSSWGLGASPLYNRAQILLLSRAFEQVAALRIWQLEHDGHYPDTLDALVPDLLPGLPLDPYSGRPFRYGFAEGQDLLPLGESGLLGNSTAASWDTRSTRPGQRLLYSVGPNGIDDGARHEYATHPSSTGELIFPLPEPEPEARNVAPAPDEAR